MSKHHDQHEDHDSHKQHEDHDSHDENNHGGHKHSSIDHSGHHEMMIRDFRKRFWISVIITIPVLLLSPMLQDLLRFEFTLFPDYDKFILFALSSVVYFYGGWPFLTGLIDELKKKQPGMMTLIAVAISVAWGYSTATTFGVEGATFFWELATLIDIMLLGHWIEMKSVLGASRSLHKLVELMPSEAHLLKDGQTKDVKVGQLHKDDTVVVRPGEKIPVDGIVTKGESNVNQSMVTVMIITCPHALGLAVPLVIAISTSMAAQHGLLIRNRTAFENSRKISALISDKTGTLTRGNFGVTRFGSLNDDFEDKQILWLAGALEVKSEHPLAMGIMQKVRDENIKYPEAQNFKAITGKGIEADVDNKKVKVVSPDFVKEKNIGIPGKAYKNEAETVVFVMVNNKLAGFIAMADELREESPEAVRVLKQSGLKLYMITGDNEKVAKSVSDELGLDGYFAGVLFTAGILISPALGAILMSTSTVIVAINAQFLKNKMNR